MGRVRLVQIVNRTTQPIDCMWDGVPEVIPPGYVVKDGQVVGAGGDGKPLSHTVEYFAAEAYKRQHPLMGSADPNSVDARDTEYLLGVEAWGDEVDHLEQSDEIELLDRSMLPEDRQNIVVKQISGARRTPSKDRKKSRKAKMVDRAKRRAAFVDNTLKNPVGIRADYD